MINKKLVIYGVGSFAEYAEYLFENDSQYSVKGYCMEKSFLENQENKIYNKQVTVFEELEKKFSPEHYHLFIAVGNNVIRERIYSAAKEKGFKLATYLSSKAVYWDNLVIGENCFVGDGSVIQPFTEIGNNSIFFTVILGHHCKIGSHALLSGCTLGGSVQVGDYSFLGLHSSIKEKISIGNKNIIGMGVVIASNTQSNEIYSAPTARKRNITFEDYFRVK